MRITGTQRLESLRKRCHLPDDAPVGIWSTFGDKAVVNKLASGGRTIEIVATTDDIDLDGEVIVPNGADMTYWAKNGYKFFADHSYGISDVAGRVVPNSLKMFPDEKNARGWRMVVGVLSNPVGDAVVTIAEETGQIGASIGFRSVEQKTAVQAGWTQRKSPDGEGPDCVHTKWDWLETSFTAMPCNASCQGTLTGEPGKMIDTLDRLVVKGRVTREVASLLGLDDRKYVAGGIEAEKKSRRILKVRRIISVR